MFPAGRYVWTLSDFFLPVDTVPRKDSLFRHGRNRTRIIQFSNDFFRSPVFFFFFRFSGSAVSTFYT